MQEIVRLKIAGPYRKKQKNVDLRQNMIVQDTTIQKSELY